MKINLKKFLRQAAENSNIPSSVWSVNKLKSYIREKTKTINQTIAEYDNAVALGTLSSSAILDDAIADLQYLSTGKTTGKRKIKMGMTGKTKAQLLIQARALQSFEKIDIYSPAAIKQREEKEQKRMNAFNRNWGANLNKKEWRSVTRILNAVRDILDDFGYEDLEVKGSIVQMLTEQVKKGKITPQKLIKIIEKINRAKKRKKLKFSTSRDAGLYFLHELSKMVSEN